MRGQGSGVEAGLAEGQRRAKEQVQVKPHPILFAWGQH